MAWVRYRTYTDGSIEWRDTETGKSVSVIKVSGGWEVEDNLPSIANKVFKSKQKAIRYARSLMKSNNRNDKIFGGNGKEWGWMVAFGEEENPRTDLSV